MVKEFIDNRGNVQVKDERRKEKKRVFIIEGVEILAKDYHSALRQYSMRNN